MEKNHNLQLVTNEVKLNLSDFSSYMSWDCRKIVQEMFVFLGQFHFHATIEYTMELVYSGHTLKYKQWPE